MIAAVDQTSKKSFEAKAAAHGLKPTTIGTVQKRGSRAEVVFL
jgi:hypothetical protein